jgi:hypothetical protein
MKNGIIIVLVMVASIIHVHLNMYTVGNFINPSFWVYLLFSINPLDKIEYADYISDIFVIEIQCIITSIIALLALKWRKLSVWIVSFLICIVIFIVLKEVINIPYYNTIAQIYSSIYHYGAFDGILLFSIIQILYITIYMLISKCLLR